MHTRDIERLRAQIRRTADKADEIIENADTIGDAGFDPSQSDKVLDQQRELLEEFGQSLADFDELLNRAEIVESDSVQYSPTRNEFSISYDESNDTVTISYTGDETIPNTDVTVLENEAEISPFNGSDISTDTSVTHDVSSLSNRDTVTLKFTQNRVQTGHKIRSWEDVLGKQGATAPSINSGDIQIPEHNLTKNNREEVITATIDRTT